MAHIRTSIRNALVTALTGLTSTGSNVFVGRMYPRSDANFPCLLVLTNDESIEDHQTQIERLMSLTVRCAAKESSGLDAALDTMIAEVEVALANVGTLSGNVNYVSAPVAIRIGHDDSLEKPVGIADIDYVVMYGTAHGVPGTALI